MKDQKTLKKSKTKKISYENKLIAKAMHDLPKRKEIRIRKEDIAKIADCSVTSVYNISYRLAAKVDFEKVNWEERLDNILIDYPEIKLDSEAKIQIIRKVKLQEQPSNPCGLTDKSSGNDY